MTQRRLVLRLLKASLFLVPSRGAWPVQQFESLYPLLPLTPLPQLLDDNKTMWLDFDCSRHKGAFTPQGPAVQVIHIPKCGGTSLRYSRTLIMRPYAW